MFDCIWCNSLPFSHHALFHTHNCTTPLTYSRLPRITCHPSFYNNTPFATLEQTPFGLPFASINVSLSRQHLPSDGPFNIFFVIMPFDKLTRFGWKKTPCKQSVPLFPNPKQWYYYYCLYKYYSHQIAHY